MEEPTINCHIRTEKEFKAPLLNKDSAVYREGLRLVSLETIYTPCGWQKQLQERGVNGMCPSF